LITGSSREWLEEAVRPLVVQFLQERGLELSAEKTHITPSAEDFDFLGQTIRRFGAKVLTPFRYGVFTRLIESGPSSTERQFRPRLRQPLTNRQPPLVEQRHQNPSVASGEHTAF